MWKTKIFHSVNSNLLYCGYFVKLIVDCVAFMGRVLDNNPHCHVVDGSSHLCRGGEECMRLTCGSGSRRLPFSNSNIRDQIFLEFPE